MRYRSDHKDQTRQRILDAAGRMFRTDGYVASGVAKVMRATGLTVGGFYAHFASKEALLSEVLARSLAATQNVLLTGLEGVEGTAFIREVARRYLSRAHRDMAADGCALPSLAAEISRQGEETREAFEDHFETLIDAFEPHMPQQSQARLTRRDQAIALAALMVGAIIFARAVKTKELSDRILLACKKFATAEASQ